MLLRFAILIFSLLLSGSGLESNAEGSLSDRSENIEVALREASVAQSIRLFRKSCLQNFKACSQTISSVKNQSSNPLPVNRKLVIQLRQLLI